MVEADREKISKSKQGAYEKPQTADAYVKKYGADVVRLWVASADFRNDIVVSDARIAKVGETYRVLRNTLRFQLSNLYDFDPACHALPDAVLTPLDRWILSAFAGLERDVAAAYAAYEFHAVYQRLAQFAAVELSAVYHDVIKDRLYTDPADAPRRRSTQTALHRMVRSLCCMLGPILSFTADEAWEFIPRSDALDSVHMADWAPSDVAITPEETAAWTGLFGLRGQVLAELEKARQAKLIGKALEARVTLRGPADVLAAAASRAEPFRELLNVSQFAAEITDSGALQIQVARAAGEKCERCWHWETEVGGHAAHPTLCVRCVEAVAAGAGK
jgi:isoleucyl-tRNA synthetase